MAKSSSFVFATLFTLAFSSCQSLEQISIDYLQPGEISFPSQLRKVAIVNNTSSIPDNKLIGESAPPRKNSGETLRAIAYATGDARIATQALAEEIAQHNYFDEVVICDSALRANDKQPRENMLMQEEVKLLTYTLGVDCIIALENLQLKAEKSVYFIPEFNYYRGSVDVKTYPIIRIYLPERTRPMTTLNPNDSVFWEELGSTSTDVLSRLKPDAQIIQEASEFAGTIPAKLLTPFWSTAKRSIYTNGSVNMRDAAVYVRENSWEKAYKLWEQAFESTKNKKKKMQIAINIAVYYEIKDSIQQAVDWATKAQQYARNVDDVDKFKDKIVQDVANIPNFYFISMYLAELNKRNNLLTKLNIQMSRFKDNF